MQNIVAESTHDFGLRTGNHRAEAIIGRDPSAASRKQKKISVKEIGLSLECPPPFADDVPNYGDPCLGSVSV